MPVNPRAMRTSLPTGRRGAGVSLANVPAQTQVPVMSNRPAFKKGGMVKKGKSK